MKQLPGCSSRFNLVNESLSSGSVSQHFLMRPHRLELRDWSSSAWGLMLTALSELSTGNLSVASSYMRLPNEKISPSLVLIELSFLPSSIWVAISGAK